MFLDSARRQICVNLTDTVQGPDFDVDYFVC